jgi:hypothetical protein
MFSGNIMDQRINKRVKDAEIQNIKGSKGFVDVVVLFKNYLL